MNMPEKHIALFTADMALTRAAISAATAEGRALRVASSSPDAISILHSDPAEFGLLVVDLDSDAHGVTLLHALNYLADRVPVVAVTSLETSYAAPVALGHGAVECLGKPVTAQQLTATIGRFWCLPARQAAT